MLRHTTKTAPTLKKERMGFPPMLRQFFDKWRKPVEEEIKNMMEEKKFIASKYGYINTKSLEFMEAFTLSPGKRIRPVLFLAGYASQGKEPSHDMIKIAAAIEMLHAFLLTHDDIMDKDDTRRGLPTVWKRFELLDLDLHTSYSLAMTTGDLEYTYVFQKILESNLHPDDKIIILERLLETVELTAYGQNLDVYYAVVPVEEVKEEDVFKVYELKTGVYTMAFPLTLGAELAGADKETLDALRNYAIRTGIAFQIHDDIIGSFGDPKKTGKPKGSDIREGKRTLLLLWALKRLPPGERKELASLVGRDEEGAVARALELIEQSGALDEARRMERELVDEAKKFLKRADITPEIRQFLDELAEFIITREK